MPLFSRITLGKLLDLSKPISSSVQCRTTVPSHKVLMRITWEKARKALSKLSAFNKYEVLLHVYVYFDKFFRLWKYRMLHSPRMTMRLWYDSLKPKEVNYSEVENTQMTSHLYSNLISCTFLSSVQYYNWFNYVSAFSPWVLGRWRMCVVLYITASPVPTLQHPASTDK